MNESKQMLEVVDENDNVVGLETKEKIHENELLHRDVHVWFLTINGGIIFQHRSKTKKLLPDKLDATVAGHVEMNESYEETAIRECKEEVGLDVNIDNLIYLTKMKKSAFDYTTGKTHNTMGVIYAYLYNGDIKDLKIEKNDGAGFELWNIDDLHNLSEIDKSKFISENISENMLGFFDKIKEKLIK